MSASFGKLRDSLLEQRDAFGLRSRSRFEGMRDVLVAV